MSQEARLILRDNPSKAMPLSRSQPTTIGRAAANRLQLATLAGVSNHHAVVRFSLSHGWLVCDWQSSDGTYLEGERIRHCRRLSDGDEIQLGADGPVLLFRLVPIAAAEAPGTGSRGAARGPQTGSSASAPARRGSTPSSGASVSGSTLTIAGRSFPLNHIRSAHVRSRQRYPHSFSWWVLTCLTGMVLLPLPWLFWSLEIGALAAWIVLGSRKEHELVVTLRDGMAHRHGFTNRLTALSHRNGIRKAIGQVPGNT